MPPTPTTITGIELGTHSVKVIMCEPQESGVLRLLGYEESPCLNRVVRGEVINVSAVADLLAECVNRLEASTRRSLHTVMLGCSGTHIRHRNDRASIPITTPDRVIGEEEVVRVTREARSHALPPERQALHTMERFFMVDDQLRTGDPMGLSGSRLTADIHTIHADRNRLQSNLNLVNDVLGREPDEVVFTGIADFYGLELIHEARPEVLVLSLGAGVTTYVLFHSNGCHHSGVLGVGMEHVANDLSVGLGISMQRARELVRTAVSALRSLEATGRQVEVPMGIGREPLRFPLATVQEIAELRLREIFEVVREDLEHHEVLSHLGHGVTISNSNPGVVLAAAFRDSAHRLAGIKCDNFAIRPDLCGHL